jgi:hypothetical protein
LQFSAVVAYVFTRIANVAVVGLANFNAILFDDVRTAALDDAERRDDFKPMLRAFCKLCH